MSDDVTAVAEVLAVHHVAILDGGCRCGEFRWTTEDHGRWSQVHREHVAAALLASPAHQALLAAAEQRGRVAALREAADDIQALHPGEVKNSVLWLRERAGREGAQ